MQLRVTVQQVLLQYGTAEVTVVQNTPADVMGAIKEVEWQEPSLIDGSMVLNQTEEIMELGDLTPAEVESIFELRALAIAREGDVPGQFTSSHNHRRKDKWYFWPMGRQPDDDVLRVIADTNIIIAARKYVAWPHKNAVGRV